VLFLLAANSAPAAELRKVSVDKIDGRYILHSEAWFDASIEQIYHTLLNWDLSTEFSSVVVESRNLDPDEEGRPQYYVRNEACVLFFCMSFEREGVIEHTPFDVIRSHVYPDKSDFYFSDETWSFREEGSGTVVVYDLEFKPKFFVPPMIGPYIIKRKLKNDSGDAINRIEAIAQRQVVSAD
jgi:hypothetical protein